MKLAFWFAVVAALFTVPKPIVSFLFLSSAVALSLIFRGDEMEDHFRARMESISFYVFITLFAFISSLSRSIEPSTVILSAVFALIFKEVLFLDRTLERKRVIRWVGLFTFGFWELFVLLSHGISIESLVESAVPLSILAATLVALRYRVAGFVLFFSLAAVYIYFFIARSKVLTSGKLAVVYLLVFPLVYLGVRSLRGGEA